MYKDRMMGYYPNIIQSISEFQAIIDAEHPEVTEFKGGIDRVISDAYLSTMSEERIKQWEKKLNIQPLVGSSISDRRETIIARIRGQGKLNTESINRIVNAFTGGTAKSWIKDSILHVEITLPEDNKSYQFANLKKELKSKLPAHIGFDIEQKYSTWEDINEKNQDWSEVRSDYATWYDVL